jgi:hypothetical protein
MYKVPSLSERCRVRLRSLLVGTALVAVLGAGMALAQQGPNCLTAEEATAIKARMLQTELMVATLSCRRAQSHEAEYNAFMDRHSAELRRYNQVIQQHFGRVGGGNPQRRYDSFTTALANDASNRSLAAANFCDETHKLFETAGAIQRGRLGAHMTEMSRIGSLRTGEQCGRDPAMQFALAR